MALFDDAEARAFVAGIITASHTPEEPFKAAASAEKNGLCETLPFFGGIAVIVDDSLELLGGARYDEEAADAAAIVEAALQSQSYISVEVAVPCQTQVRNGEACSFSISPSFNLPSASTSLLKDEDDFDDAAK